VPGQYPWPGTLLYSMTLRRAVTVIFAFIFLICIVEKALSVDRVDLLLQVIKQPEGEVLLQFPVEKGDLFHVNYTHSSDHTPVHDTFKIDDKGTIVLIEEDYEWYGAGLEFHPDADAKIFFTGDRVRVLLNRVFPHLPLRVGRVAGHTLTYKDRTIPLLAIAKGGDRLWILTVKKGARHE